MYSDRILTVTTPAGTTDLVTLAVVKAALGITGSAEDAELDKLIDRASAAVQAYCNRIFASEGLSETVRPSRSIAKLGLTKAPITAIASIIEDDVTLAAADYEADLAPGVLYRLRSDCRAAWCAKKIVVAYTAGYAAIPEDVQAATIKLVATARAGAGRDAALKEEEIPGVIRQQFWIGQIGDHGAFPPEVVGLLQAYRRILV